MGVHRYTSSYSHDTRDERDAQPRAAEILKAHLYIDDFLSGADTIQEARAIRDEIIALLKQGGFPIRQWASNDKNIINDLEESEIREFYNQILIAP